MTHRVDRWIWATSCGSSGPECAAPLTAGEISVEVRLSRRRVELVCVWLIGAAVLGALLAASAASSSPLDDADLAQQRAGMLDVVGPRSSVPVVSPGMPAAGRVTVVFFIRPGQLDELGAALGARDGRRLARAADLAVVVSVLPVAARRAFPSAVPVVADAAGRLADGFRMRPPRDGGPPVGYAVVGRDRTVRFRTEDPGVSARLDEVLILAKAAS